jgi:hypothetical protein
MRMITNLPYRLALLLACVGVVHAEGAQPPYPSEGISLLDLIIPSTYPLVELIQVFVFYPGLVGLLSGGCLMWWSRRLPLEVNLALAVMTLDVIAHVIAMFDLLTAYPGMPPLPSFVVGLFALVTTLAFIATCSYRRCCDGALGTGPLLALIIPPLALFGWYQWHWGFLRL